MSLPYDAFSAWLLLSTAGLLAMVLAWATRNAPWRWLLDPRHLNALCGGIVVLTLAWHMRASAHPGLEMHLLGATLMTLVGGARLALIALTTVLVATTLNGDAAWTQLGTNAIVTVLVPVGTSAMVLRFVERHLPPNFFVYIFVGAFLGAGLSALLAGAAATALLLISGSYAFDTVTVEFAPYFLLLAFSEAWLTGILMTALVIYRPEYVSTFDDARYLAGR